MCLLGACKLNVTVCAGYLEGVLNFTTKIPIKPKLGVFLCLLGAWKLNVVVWEDYLKESFNFIAKIPINPKLGV